MAGAGAGEGFDEAAIGSPEEVAGVGESSELVAKSRSRSEEVGWGGWQWPNVGEERMRSSLFFWKSRSFKK